MAPKKALRDERDPINKEWGGISITRGAIVECRDACAMELMLRVNAEARSAVIHAYLEDTTFFVEQSKVAAFKTRADELLNPLGRKRAKAQQDDADDGLMSGSSESDAD